MTEVRTSRATLDGLPVISAEYTSTLSGQVTWSATVDGYHALSPSSATHTLSIDGWTSPPLIGLTSEATTNPPSTTYSGSDLWTYKMSASGLTMPTFTGQTAAAIVQAIGTQAGVTIDTNAWFLGGTIVPEYNVQAGTSLLEFVTRLLRDFPCGYRVRPDGLQLVNFTPLETYDVAHKPNVTGVRESLNLSDITTGVRVRVKRKDIPKFELVASGPPGRYTGSIAPGFPLNALTITTQNVRGILRYIIAYDANGAVCGAFAYDIGGDPYNLPPVVSTLPAVTLGYETHPGYLSPVQDTYVKITVTAGAYTYGAPFEVSYDIWNQTGREKLLQIDSTLFPDSLSVKVGQLVTWANMHVHTITYDTPINPYQEVGGSVISHSMNIGRGAPMSSVTESIWVEHFAP